MSGPIVVAIDGDNRGLSRSLDSSKSKISGLSRVAGTAGRAVAAGLAVAAAGVIALGVKSVKAASDAEQSLGATETVFGRFSDTVVKTSKRAATTFGLSANEYRESANLIGSLFRNQGVEADKLAGKTRGMIKTGSDLAATYGGTTREAVEALGSAFKGEFDPLERYGISIKQSAINAELAANGQEKLEGQALKTAQQIATSKLIMEQSSRAAGAFGRESNTLAHVQQVLGAQSENLQAKIGGALTPSLTKLGNAVSADVMPYLSDLADKYAPKVAGWIDKLSDKIPDLIAGFRGGGDSTSQLSSDLGKVSDAAGELAPELRKAGREFPSLHDGLNVFGVGLSFAADHVDELRTALPYLVAGLAAYKGAQLANQLIGRDSLAGFALQLASTRSLTTANRQLAVSLQQVNGAQGVAAGGAVNTTSKLSKLGGAARLAAGAGGMVALTKASGETNKALSATENVLGGVAMGFAMGGPIGALIGGLGGVAKATYDLTDPTDALAAAQRELGHTYSGVKSKASDYAGTLDQVTGAITRQTRASVLQEAQDAGVLPLLNQLHVAGRDVIGTVTGQAGATRRLNAAIGRHRNELTGLQELKINEWLGINTRGFAQQQKQVRENNRDLTSWKKALKGLPPKVQTAVKQIGADASAAQIRRLKRQYDLNPKQVKTIVQAIGTETTIRKVRGVWQVFEDGAKVRANLNPWQRDLAAGVAGGKRTADRGASDVNQLLFAGTGKAKANLAPFNSSLTGGINTARGNANSGGSGVGASLASGVASGIAANEWQAVNAAVALVTAAVNAARSRRGADAHSPSRKTKKLGGDMAHGVRDGLRKEAHKAQREASKLITGAMRGMVAAAKEGTKPLAKQFEQLHRLIKKNDRIGGNDSALIKRLKGEEAQLRTVTRRYEQVSKAIADARNRLQQLRDLATQTTQAAIAGASVVTVGGEAGTISAGTIQQGMLEKLEATKAFSAKIAELTAQGLNKTALRQLIDAGVDGGLETAQAIAAGGPKAIREMNNLQGQINSAAGNLGDNSAKAMHEGGVKAAEGFLTGLQTQQTRLERAARRIAQQIARQLRGGKAGKLVKAPQIDLVEHTFAKRAELSRPAAHQQRASVTVKLSAEQLSALQRGKAIRMDLDAWDGRGGRRRAAGA